MKKLKSNLSAIAITGIILTGCQEDNPNNAVTSNNVSSSISTSKPSSATQVYNLSTSSSNVNNTEPTTTAVPIPSPDDEKTFNQYMYNGSEQAKVENKSSKSTVNSPEIRKQNAEYRKVIEKQYAEINNISLGEAKKRLAIMGNTDAVSMVKEYFGNDLTGIYYGLDEKGNFGLNVRTVKRTNRSVQDDTFVKSVLDKTNVPINLQSNASLSEKQINESIKLNSTEAKKILPSIQAVGYSPIEDVIYIEFYDKNKKYKEVEIASLETQLNKLFSYKVKLKQLDTPTESLSVIGGGELGNGSQSLFTSSCTSGFTAILNGVKGVLTAGHCYVDNLTLYRGYDNYNVAEGLRYYPLGQGVINQSPSIDMAFYPVSTSDNYLGAIYQKYKTSSILYVNKIGTPSDFVPGTTFCHYGKNTDTNCGVFKRFVTPTGNSTNFGCNGYATLGYCDNSFAQVENNGQLKVVKGDSGGPWYYINPYNEIVALGITSASTYYADGRTYTATFSPIYKGALLGSLAVYTTN